MNLKKTIKLKDGSTIEIDSPLQLKKVDELSLVNELFLILEIIRLQYKYQLSFIIQI